MHNNDNLRLPEGRQALAASGSGSHSPAFTLIEMIVVAAIIAILASMMVGVSKYANRAMKESSARSEIERMANCLQTYFVNHGCFPNDLKGITNKLSSSFSINNEGAIFDPWDNEYIYTNNSLSYTLYSSGVNANPTNVEDDIILGK